MSIEHNCKNKYRVLAIYFVVLVTILLFPPVFNNYVNQIKPLVMGLPFLHFVVFGTEFLIAVGLIAWYLIDSACGKLDYEIKEEERIDVFKYINK